jgi:hypothetical protein
LINNLVEFSQRCDLVSMEKGKMLLKFKEGEKSGEVLNYNGETFLFKDNQVFKITDKVENSDMNEVSKSMESQKTKKEVEVKPRVFEVIKKKFGDFEIVMLICLKLGNSIKKILLK